MELTFFTSGDLTLKVPVTPDQETVWLTQDQMSELFDTARSSIAYHISRIFKEGELEKDTSVEFFDRRKLQDRLPTIILMLLFLSAIV